MRLCKLLFGKRRARERILDLGCGDGALAVEIGKVIAVNLSEGAIVY